MPVDVTIELTNVCNAHCTFCPHDNMKREQGFISFSTLDTISKDLEGVDISGINPVGLGEPLLHPKFFTIIDYLHGQYPKVPIRIATNGIELNGLKSADLKRHLDDIDSILISLNFGTPDDYQKYMGVNKYSQVINNIETLLFLKPKFSVKVQYLVTKQNILGLPGFILKWKPKVDILFIRYMEDWGGRVDTRHLQLFVPPKYDVDQIVYTWDGQKRNSCLELAD